jgi:hypothetical protein
MEKRKNKPGQGRKRKLTRVQVREIMLSKLAFSELAEKYKVSLTVLYRSIKVYKNNTGNFIDNDKAAA